MFFNAFSSIEDDLTKIALKIKPDQIPQECIENLADMCKYQICIQECCDLKWLQVFKNNRPLIQALYDKCICKQQELWDLTYQKYNFILGSNMFFIDTPRDLE